MLSILAWTSFSSRGGSLLVYPFMLDESQQIEKSWYMYILLSTLGLLLFPFRWIITLTGMPCPAKNVGNSTKDKFEAGVFGDKQNVTCAEGFVWASSPAVASSISIEMAAEMNASVLYNTTGTVVCEATGKWSPGFCVGMSSPPLAPSLPHPLPRPAVT